MPFEDASKQPQHISETTTNEPPQKKAKPTPTSEPFTTLNVSDVRPLACRRPTFANQTVISKPGVYPLDNENLVMLFTSLLIDADLDEYLQEAVKVSRSSGRSGFGWKPRREVCYSPDGAPYIYSRIAHATLKYPNHVLKVASLCCTEVDKALQKEGLQPNPYITLSSGVDIIYDASFPLGGSISAHKDDEQDWGMVIIFSLGQTRYLRVRCDTDRKWYNIEMTHNSVVVMYGPSFQKNYTHQVDKLHRDDKIGVRLSLNMRYEKAK